MIIRAFKDDKDGYYQIVLEDGEELPEWANGMIETAVQTPVLTEAQTSQSATIDQAYSAAVTADISFTTAAGVTAVFQADGDSQQVLSVSVQGYDMVGSVPDGFFWKAADNAQVAFTLSDLKGLYRAMLDRGWLAFKKRTDLKDAIAAAKTVAEVQAITWS